MTLPQIFFAYFFVMILGLAVMVVTRRNLVHAVLWMLLMFVHIGGLYLFLNAEFFAIIQIIVYAGAILVMFLFVLLLLNVKQSLTASLFIRGWQGRAMAVVFLLLVFVISIKNLVIGPRGEYSIQRIEQQGHIKVIGEAMFNDYILPFMIIGLILFVPMIAAAVLAMRRHDGSS
ncbi:MAG: NADH-quinone oxidoreductase subunit J [Thermodesulfovibrionales bacterium]|nr:NADH-quinone oxidoreductase subunit J [Thermodesulfovibrionales bacterium]